MFAPTPPVGRRVDRFAMLPSASGAEVSRTTFTRPRADRQRTPGPIPFPECPSRVNSVDMAASAVCPLIWPFQTWRFDIDGIGLVKGATIAGLMKVTGWARSAASSAIATDIVPLGYKVTLDEGVYSVVLPNGMKRSALR
jgi:hypothetical protein